MRQSSLAKIGGIDAVSISIDREIASRYDNVKIVADNIDAVTLLGTPEAIASISNVAENVDLILNAASAAEDARDAILGMGVATGAQGTSVVWDGTTLTIPRGNTGLQGIQGVQGKVGPQGIQGPIGATGPQGVKGDTGATGPQGVKGDKGATGAQGIQGIQGLKGDKGATGAQGIQGVQGVKGDTGDIGPANTLTVGTVLSGSSPSASITGVSPNQILNLVLQQGPQGIQGIQGLKGDTGADGKGIVSVVKTSGTGAAGTTDVYTITYTDASQSSFNVYNGANGLGSGDMLKSAYDSTNNGKVDIAEVADKWTTGRTLTVGSTGKLIDGSGNVSWSLAEIGAQALDADLTAIAALAGTSGLLKKTAANTWTLDTAAYTTNLGTVTGVTGTAPVVSSGGTAPVISLAAGYGDTLKPFASKTANYVLAAPSGSAGVPTFRALTSTDIPVLNQTTTGSAATLTTGRTLSITGDITWTSPLFDGSGNVTAAGTLATVNSNVGAFTNANVTVNEKGLVTAVSSGTAPVTTVTGTGPIVSSGGTAPAISISAATTSAAGSMSAADKTKLNGVATGANNYAHPTGDGNLHVPATGTANSGKVLTAGATAGSLSWTTIPAGVTDHTLLSNIGTNTHAQIDTALTRLANTSGTNTGDQTNITGNAATATTATNVNGGTVNATTGRFADDIIASKSITIGTGGTFSAGSIFSDSNWGMLFRAKQSSPAMGQFMWANSEGAELFRFNGTALTTNITGNAATATYATTAGSCTGNAATATYLSTAQQSNAILGANKPTSIIVNDSINNGSFVCRATGTGDGNLAGMTFWNEAYAIRLGVRNDGVFGIGGWSRSTWSWYSDSAGNMVASGNVTAYSDPRLKENFVNIENPIELVKKLNGGTFNWKHGFTHTEVKAGKKDYGILANEVEAIMPEIVTDSIDIDGEKYKTVCYEKIVPLLIEAIKEQQKQIDELKALAKGA